MNVLVINCGSSSLKYQLINSDTEDVLAKGLCERIGIDGRLVYQKAGCDKEITEAAMPTHKEAIQMVLDALVNDKTGAIKSLSEVNAVGHRIVHGGEKFASSAVITDNLYKFVLKQSQEFATEALNAHQRTLRMRGRPKIVLTRTYEEAMDLYNKYEKNVLGIITDARYPRGGVVDPMAGIKLLAEIRSRDPFIPLILQSSEVDNKVYAGRYDASFVDKNSKKMNIDLREIISEHFGFGDFIFRNPDTFEEVARVRNLKELQNIIFSIPKESLLYHISRNHVSRWLYSRAMFPPAEFLKQITWKSLHWDQWPQNNCFSTGYSS